MRAYVGVTDGDWYRFLRARRLTEANFWQPSGGKTRFGAIESGAPFLFKSHKRDGDRLVGVGFLSGWARLSMTRAWEFFGEGNGCATIGEMRSRIGAYRKGVIEPDPEIGCIMLRDIMFFEEHAAPAAPPDWRGNIVQGKGYELDSPDGSYVDGVLRRLLLPPEAGFGGTGLIPGPIFGDPRLAPVRLGQAAFKALVQEAYQRRCAVTGDKIVPVLQAAHIRPVTSEGQNRVDNGLLLRSDVHTLFDRGYLSVHPSKHTLLVSPRLRTEWGNGDEFYRRASSGEPVASPLRDADRPNEEFLTWHADEVFLR